MSTVAVSRRELRLELPAARSSVPAVRHTVDVLLADLGVGADRSRIALAVSEACSNVVLHAYRDDRASAGRLIITVEVTDDGVHVVVADDGAGVVPRRDSSGAGFGLSLMRALADELYVGRTGGRTEVEMRFR